MTEVRKRKIEQEVLPKLDEAILNLQSIDIVLRKKGMRHLSDRSRMAMGDYKAEVVGNWFLNDYNRETLFKIIGNEMDEIIQAELLHVLYWICCRHASRLFSNLPEDLKYKERVKVFTERFINTTSIPVLAAVGVLLAYFKDSRAWDLFVTVLERQRDYLTLARFKYAYNDNDGDQIITENQKAKLNEILSQIRAKTKNNKVSTTASNLK